MAREKIYEGYDDNGDYVVTYREDSTTGGKEKVSYREDGSGYRHGGGPCGPTDFDKFGNT